MIDLEFVSARQWQPLDIYVMCYFNRASATYHMIAEFPDGTHRTAASPSPKEALKQIGVTIWYEARKGRWG